MNLLEYVVIAIGASGVALFLFARLMRLNRSYDDAVARHFMGER